MGLSATIQEVLESIEKLACPDDDLDIDGILEQKRSHQRLLQNHIDIAQKEIESLKESLRSLEEAKTKKTKTISERNAQIEAVKVELEAIREDARKNKEKLVKYTERKARASSEISPKDSQAMKELRAKLSACVGLTGVHFNPSNHAVSGGYVVNSATSKVKFFDVGNLPREKATKKLWETMEKTSACSS